MPKQPAFQFYPGDWLRDPQLQMASSSTRGIWMNCLCHMWFASERGKLAGPKMSIARLLNASIEDFDLFLTEAETFSFCDVKCDMSRQCHKMSHDVTLINRRMFREEKEREDARLRKQRQREREAGHANVTPLSPSPTPSPTPKTGDTSVSPSDFPAGNSGEEPPVLSVPEQIQKLKSRYTYPDMIDRCIECIALTRKKGRLAPNVVLKILQQWGGMGVARVEAGIQVYLDGKYWANNLGENYLWGIIRKTDEFVGDLKDNGKPKSRRSQEIRSNLEAFNRFAAGNNTKETIDVTPKLPLLEGNKNGRDG